MLNLKYNTKNGSRWLRSKIQSSPCSTNKSKIHLQMQWFSQNILNAGIRPKTSKRARKSPCNRATTIKNKGIRTGPEPLGGNGKHGKLSPHREVRSPAETLALGWAGAGCWGSGLRGQSQERTGVGCVGTAWGARCGHHNWGSVGRSLGYYLGGHKKRGDCHRSCFLHTLSGSRAPPTHAPGVGVSLCCHLKTPQADTDCYCCWGSRDRAPRAAPAFLEPVQATHLRISYQGDNGQHTLRKETASTQTSNCPHAKKCETHMSYPESFPLVKSPPRYFRGGSVGRTPSSQWDLSSIPGQGTISHKLRGRPVVAK